MPILSKIFFWLIMLALGFNNAYAASNGSYLSAKIGEEKLSAFISFKVIDQNIPNNTSIKYQFAGYKDNYASWSDPQSTSDTIDLSKISQLKQSQYLKVKISMNSNNNDLPSLKGFEVTYDTIGSQSSASFSTNSNSASSNSTSSNSAISSSDTSSVSSTTTTNNSSPITKTEKVSLSQSQKKQILTGIGNNILLNIAIALILTAIISYLIFRNKQQEGL